MAKLFPYRIDKRLLPLLAAFGVRPGRDGVRLEDDGRFVATFGWLRLSTPRANVKEAHTTGGYRWWRAIGARLSLKDDGLTFGTNTDTGVCVHFREKVPSLLRPRGHSAVTVTVADPDGLIGELEKPAG